MSLAQFSFLGFTHQLDGLLNLQVLRAIRSDHALDKLLDMILRLRVGNCGIFELCRLFLHFYVFGDFWIS